MSLITLKELLDHAAENNYAVPAFNINNLEQIQAVMNAANKVNSPVILQISIGARQYAGENFLQYLFKAALKSYPKLPIVVHQDHGTSPKICIRSIQLGFSSIMMDGSLMEDAKTPSTFQYNANVTKSVVDIAHSCGVSVEGELGCLGSLETGIAGKEDHSGAEGILSKDQLLTDPEEARNFVKLTKVDALAIAIGTSHGAYKFTVPPSKEVLAIDHIKKIHKKIPNTHLVMHGSSSIPQNLLKIINNHGGNIKQTYGVPISEIQRAIHYGVRKINIDTDLRIAATSAVRSFLSKKNKVFDPREYNKKAREAMSKICQMRYEEFKSAGKAHKIQSFSLEEMANKY